MQFSQYEIVYRLLLFRMLFDNILFVKNINRDKVMPLIKAFCEFIDDVVGFGKPDRDYDSLEGFSKFRKIIPIELKEFSMSMSGERFRYHWNVLVELIDTYFVINYKEVVNG